EPEHHSRNGQDVRQPASRDAASRPHELISNRSEDDARVDGQIADVGTEFLRRVPGEGVDHEL
ncbi:hypothetical protein PENTCL1PPCAC_13888, partial [Pristionchus entomophagus]